jgi:hypothetical protein
MSNTRWNKEDFRHVIEQWKVSGFDKKSFCNSQGISYGRFLYWFKRLAETSSAAPSVPSLARLEVISAQCKHQTSSPRQKKLSVCRQSRCGTKSGHFL